MVPNEETWKKCHSMSKIVNFLYFKCEFKEQEWGYSFNSPVAKVREKNVVINPELWNLKSGERIQVFKFKDAIAAEEVIYHLPSVLDREKFNDKKSFTNRVKYPLNLAARLGLNIRLLDKNLPDLILEKELTKIKQLHDEWVDKKLENPKVHRNSFSRVRYLRSIQQGLSLNQCYLYVIEDEERNLVSIRQIGKSDDTLFDISSITKFWMKSQLSESTNILSIKKFQEDFPNVNNFNTGLASSSLKEYKCHFPHQVLKVWRKVFKDSIESIDNFFS